MPIRVLLADDHTLFRRGLLRLLADHDEFEVVAEAATGLEAIELAREFQPDVAIVDIGMPELNGVEATTQILHHSPNTAVLILSMHNDERYVVRSVRAGARGYILKDAVEDGLFAAIHLLHNGHAYFSPAVAKVIQDRRAFAPESTRGDDRYDLLTERERQVYQLLAEGKSNKEVASRLGLSVHTAETHRARIMEKMGLHSIAELVLSASRRGLVR
jgi:two-component system response regulator NreC